MIFYNIKGKVFLIDYEDFDLLISKKWCVSNKNNGLQYYLMWTSRRKYTRKNYSIYFHSEVIKRMYNITSIDKGLYVDHINTNSCDNRRCNLRLTTASQNIANSRKKSGTMSKYKGVDMFTGRNRWRARIKVGQETKYLGCYKTEEEAAKAYDKAALYYFGEFARTNEMLDLL